MALVKCGECQKLISSSAKRCPNCGAPTQYGKEKEEKITMVAIWFLVVLALIITLLIIDKQNDKIVGTWSRDTTDAFLKQYGASSTESYTFNEDGTCVQSSTSTNSWGFTREKSSQCKFKLRNDEIIITWMEEDDMEPDTMPFSYGGSYIIIDDEKYEREY